MLRPIDTNESTPRHQQVYDSLLGHIRDGFWVVGEKIPAELELAAELGVAKLTIHRAVQTLARDGWVTRRVGKGTFVAPRRIVPALKRVVLTFGSSTSNILGSDYYGNLYRGIAEGLGPGVELVLSPESFGTTQLPQADGILVIAPRAAALAPLQKQAQTGTPLVVIGAHWPEVTLPTVDSDNQAAARLAVNHLMEQGHRQLALLYSEPETANIRDRIIGFRAEAQRQQLSFTEHEATTAWQLTCAEKESLLGSVQSGTTAIFTAGYYLALDVLNTLREANFSVPRDVSLVAFDDPVSARLVYPPLTTLRQPLFEMGKRAAQRLLALATNTDDGSTELLPVVLVPRSSTISFQGNEP